MSYKWGHPVATFPVTNRTIRHTRRITEILRITLPDAIVEDVGGTPKRSWHHGSALIRLFSPGTRMETTFPCGTAQILLDGELCMNKKNEFVVYVSINGN
eukprot:4627507-Pleurochrysis_carterae.AAC.1